jgi:hypothetical protein
MECDHFYFVLEESRGFFRSMPELDLNVLPSHVPEFASSMDIRVVCKRKVDSREVLIRKYGEVGYNAMIQSLEPVILSHVMHSSKIILFVLYN